MFKNQHSKKHEGILKIVGTLLCYIAYESIEWWSHYSRYEIWKSAASGVRERFCTRAKEKVPDIKVAALCCLFSLRTPSFALTCGVLLTWGSRDVSWARIIPGIIPNSVLKRELNYKLVLFVDIDKLELKSGI